MKTRFFLIILLLPCLHLHAQTVNAGTLDNFFPAQADFVMSITEFENNTQKRTFEFEGSLKGDTLYLLVASQPRVMRGWVQLRQNDTIFSYNRDADIIRQTSAESSFLQSLFSQEDIMTIRLQALYRVGTISNFSDVGYPRIRVTYLPKSSHYSYARIESVYDATTMYPLSRSYFSEQGRLVKSMIITNLEFTGDRLTRYEFTMMDNLRPGYFANVVFRDWNSEAAIPDSLFTQASMRFLAK